METFIKADIFFFISSIGIILITIAVLVTAYFISRASREIESLSKTIQKEVEDFSDEVEEMRKKISPKFFRNVFRDHSKKREKLDYEDDVNNN
jgi:uncharacterized membrane protein YgaE (UPF0421/DUF939 family)